MFTTFTLMFVTVLHCACERGTAGACQGLVLMLDARVHKFNIVLVPEVLDKCSGRLQHK